MFIHWRYNPDKIPNSIWKESIYYPIMGSIKRTKLLHQVILKNLKAQLKNDKIWRRTRYYTEYKWDIEKIQQAYITKVKSILLNPNKKLGFTFKSSLTSMGILPTKKGVFKVHTKYL